MAERIELTPVPGARGKALFPRIVSEAVMALLERKVSARVIISDAVNPIEESEGNFSANED